MINARVGSNSLETIRGRVRVRVRVEARVRVGVGIGARVMRIDPTAHATRVTQGCQ